MPWNHTLCMFNSTSLFILLHVLVSNLTIMKETDKLPRWELLSCVLLNCQTRICSRINKQLLYFQWMCFDGLPLYIVFNYVNMWEQGTFFKPVSLILIMHEKMAVQCVCCSRFQSQLFNSVAYFTNENTVKLGCNIVNWLKKSSLQTSHAVSEMYGKSEVKIFQDKIQACRHIT
jgi:hypothetical protein